MPVSFAAPASKVMVRSQPALAASRSIAFGDCPHPQQIIHRFEPAFEGLLLTTTTLPWDETQ